MLKCKKCGSSFENSKYLNINRYNNPDKYLHTCKECRKLKKCKNCNIEFKHHQNITCSKKCAEELKKKTYMKSQGTPHNFSKNSKSRLKFEKTLVENEGINNVFQRESVKKSIEQTIVKRYGVDNISKSNEIKKKKKITLKNTLSKNPNLFKEKWWNLHDNFIRELGYDPRLGVLGKASIESLSIFNKIIQYCYDIGIKDEDIYIGIDDKSEYFINTGTKTYFYDFCIRSKKIIIEYHGIGFHANPNWDTNKLNEWRSVFTNETSRENIRKTKIKNNAAIKKGFKILEIWGDCDIDENIKKCKNFIKDNYEN